MVLCPKFWQPAPGCRRSFAGQKRWILWILRYIRHRRRLHGLLGKDGEASIGCRQKQGKETRGINSDAEKFGRGFHREASFTAMRREGRALFSRFSHETPPGDGGG